MLAYNQLDHTKKTGGDRGSQYTSGAFRRRLRRVGAKQSMSRKGDCWDNSVAESFLATLKKELIYDLGVVNAATIKLAVFDCIEVLYNRTRLHASLGVGYSPAQFEDCHQQRAAAWTSPGMVDGSSSG